MTIIQHIPAFVDDRVVPEYAEFSTLPELLKIPWVANFMKDPAFFRFSMDTYLVKPLLIAEYEGGANWWVVGALSEPIAGLPKWELLEGEE